MAENIVWMHPDGTYSVTYVVEGAAQQLATHLVAIGVLSTEDKIVGFNMPDDFIKKVQAILPIETVRKNLDAYISQMIDTAARASGFDNMLSAASYVTSTVKSFKADAVALVKWRDSTWDQWLSVRSGEDGDKLTEFVMALPKAPS